MSPTSNKKKISQPIRSSTEFARYVGLARTTVSRVLNGQPGLKPKTIERVRRAMEETGFVPNAYALHLKGKQPAAIGICVQSLVSQPVIHKLAVLQRRLREKGHPSFIEVMEGGGEWDVIRHFLSLRVAAVVFLGHFQEDLITRHVNTLNGNHTPHLVLEQMGIRGANTIALDRVKGMNELISHLLALGHRSFNLLAFSSSMRSTRDRLRAVHETLQAAGLDPAQCVHSLDHCHTRVNDFEHGRELARSFITKQGGDLSTAFVAINDEIAIGAMHELQAAGINVPGDVSVAGFNNQDICLMTTPTLTSVDQSVDAVIDSAVEAILGQISQAHSRKSVMHLVDPTLKVRASTGPARSGPLVLRVSA